MTRVQDSYKVAKDLLEQSGQGILERDGEHALEDFLLSKCKFFYELDPIYGSHPKFKALITTESDAYQGVTSDLSEDLRTVIQRQSRRRNGLIQSDDEEAEQVMFLAQTTQSQSNTSTQSQSNTSTTQDTMTTVATATATDFVSNLASDFAPEERSKTLEDRSKTYEKKPP